MNFLELGNRLVRRSLQARGVLSQTRRVAGVDVHFYKVEGTGSGPPALMIHGLGSSANAFFRTLQPLAKTFREVWAIDLPGNGFSPVPAGGPLSVRTFVELILAFRRDVIGREVFLIGNSLGGGMSLYAASAEPESFKGLALISPAGAKLTQERFDALLKSFALTDVKSARVFANKLFAKPPLPMLLFAGELRNLVGTETVKSIVKEVGPADAVTEEMLAKLTMPTLLIWGQREKLLPYEGLQYFRANLPKSAEVREVEGFGHMPQMEHPERFVDEVTSFAKRRGLA
jgi:pimeloyl-ACP methyl ester carboxylesterase